MKPKPSDMVRENAQNCADKAKTTKPEPTPKRFKRIKAAWLAQAEEQDWLDGETSPAGQDAVSRADWLWRTCHTPRR